MNRTRITTWRPLLVSSCLVVLLMPAAAQADGSITFNGTTSVLQNTISSTDILDGSDKITITAWINAAGVGEGDGGIVTEVGVTDEIFLAHSNSANSYSFNITRATTSGKWTFTAGDGKWHCLQVVSDIDDNNDDPEIYVDGVLQNESEVTQPSGSISVGYGYWVGNNNAQSRTWNGQIAHVQIHNRVLSTAELQACRQAPGSVRDGLRLWLPMTNASETKDRSGNGFDDTGGVDLVTYINGPMLTNQPGALPGFTVLNYGWMPVSQQVVPRYANGVSHPAGRIVGQGPGSVIQGTVYGSSDGNSPQVIVQTEDYEEDTVLQWQSEVPGMGEYPAVLVPTFTDFTIAGRDYDGIGYTLPNGVFHYNNTPIPSPPWYAPATPAAVVGGAGSEGVTFNNSSSTARNASANVLNGAKTVTVCFWARAANRGEDGYGRVMCIGDGETANDSAFRIYHQNANDTLAINKQAGSEPSNEGIWTIPFTDGAWNSVCVRLDFSMDSNNPTARVNKKPVTVSQVGSEPSSMQDDPTNTYTVGNNSGGSGTWDGQIAHVQVWNRILNDTEADAAVDDPGSVTNGLRLYLSLTNDVDTSDQSGNGFHATTTTALATHPGFHDREIGLGIRASGPRIKSVRHFNIAGRAGVIYRPNGTQGVVLPFDEEMVKIDDIHIYRCYAGYELNAVDTHIGSVEIQYVRDYGLKFSTAGGYKIRGPIHVSGCFSGRPDYQAPCVWFASGVGGSWGGPWYVETADIGMLIESSGNKFGPIYTQYCTYDNLRITGQRNYIGPVEILMSDGVTEVYGREGIYVSGVSNTIPSLTTATPVPSGEVLLRLAGDGCDRFALLNASIEGTDSSSKPIISVDSTLNNSWIVANFVNGGDGLDLYTDTGSGPADRIGANNYIWITAFSLSGEMINFDPTGWDKDTNLIVVNGIRVLGSITGATNANPIVITSAAHELRDGEKIAIQDVQGNTSANGSYYADVLSADTFALYTNEALTTGRAGNGTYTANTGYWGKRFNSVDVAGN